MIKKSIHEELEQRIKMLEEELSRCKHDVDILQKCKKKGCPGNTLYSILIWNRHAKEDINW